MNDSTGTRVALRRSEAAAALGVSDEAFDRYVRPTLPVVRCGTLRLYPVAALVDWLAERATTPAADLERAA
jgi:phage terminase Nu1 subunit (DNA packaging protein)